MTKFTTGDVGGFLHGIFEEKNWNFRLIISPKLIVKHVLTCDDVNHFYCGGTTAGKNLLEYKLGDLSFRNLITLLFIFPIDFDN